MTVAFAVNKIPSAATTNIGATDNGEPFLSITGTTSITSFGSTAPLGAVRFIKFRGALTLVYNVTSMIIPGAANVTTAAGDYYVVRHEGSGNWRILNRSRTAPCLSLLGMFDRLTTAETAAFKALMVSSGVLTQGRADDLFAASIAWRA